MARPKHIYGRFIEMLKMKYKTNGYCCKELQLRLGVNQPTVNRYLRRARAEGVRLVRTVVKRKVYWKIGEGV